MKNLSEKDKIVRAAAVAEARARSERSHRFAQLSIPLLNAVAYGSVFIAIVGSLVHMLRG